VDNAGNPYRTPDAEVSSHPALQGQNSQGTELRGLGGWLILVGIGVVFAPLRLALFILATYVPMFSDGTWEALTSPGSADYHALWGPLIVGEIIFNTIMILAGVYLIYLFFSKHHLFPRLYIAVVLITLLVIPIDAWLVTLIIPGKPAFDPATLKEFIRTLVGAMIWVPYMFISKRVKQTFVEKAHSVPAGTSSII
jgi:magnesium-transporting ATPase (P-type)